MQLGLTATPKRTDNADTYAYFGEPAYVYSLRKGIEDGYLTPFRVRKYGSNRDTYESDGIDKVLTGDVEEGDTFEEADFNRKVFIGERELHRVRTFLSEINIKEKTIVFCATQDHAALIRDLINQKVQSPPKKYCVRVTADVARQAKLF